MINLELFVIREFWAFIRQTKSSSHLIAVHGLPFKRAASADLASTSAAADTALGDVHAADGDKINGTSLQKSVSAFFGVLET